MSRSVANSCSRSKKAHVYDCVWVQCRVKECVYVHSIEATSVVRCRTCVCLSCVWSSVCSCVGLLFCFCSFKWPLLVKTTHPWLERRSLSAPRILTNCNYFSMWKSQGDMKKSIVIVIIMNKQKPEVKVLGFVWNFMVKWVQLWGHGWMSTCTMNKLSLQTARYLELATAEIVNDLA